MAASRSPLVSIIVPVFNAEATLGETLASALAQTYTHTEILVVNDGSTDGSMAVAREVAERDQRVRILTQENRGVSAARNHGLAQARGERVMFLDSDDWVSPEYLTRMLAALARKPSASVAYCGYSRVPADGVPLRPDFVPGVQHAAFETLSLRCAFAIHCLLLPRQLVIDLGGFDTTLKTCEDWDLWLRIARSGAIFTGIPDAMAFYRATPGSASRDMTRMIKDTRVVLDRIRSADPRVKTPEPRYANGLENYPASRRLLTITLFLAAVQISDGHPGDELMHELEDLPDCRHAVLDVLRDILNGLSMLHSNTQLARRWNTLEPLLLRLCVHLEAVTAQTAAALVTGIKVIILEYCDLSVPVQLGDLHARELDIDKPIPDLDLSADTRAVVLRLTTKGEVIEDIRLPGFSSIKGVHLHRLILDQWGLSGTLEHGVAGRTLRLPRDFARKTMRMGAEILKSKRQRRPRLLALAANSARDLAAFAHLVASYPPQPRQSSGLRDRARAAAQVAQLREAVLGKTSPMRDAAPRRRDSARRGEISAAPIPILMFHRVAADGPAELAQYRVSEDQFAEQLAFLRSSGFQTISPDEFLAARAGHLVLPARPIMLTFDDGYSDFYHAAWPLLEKYGFTADVFIVTGKAGKDSDWDAAYGPTAPLMDWGQIQDLHARGARFGSHLVTHRRAPELDDDELVREAALSRFALESHLGSRVTSIALPFGAYTPRVLDALGVAGYDFALTCDDACATLKSAPLKLPRIEICGGDTLEAFARKLGLTAGTDREVAA